MSSTPTCPACGGWLRWEGSQWLCDRCRVAYPAQPQQPAYAPQPQQPAYPVQPQQAHPQSYPQPGSQPYQMPGYPHPAQAAPPRSKKKIIIIVGALLVVGAGVTLAVVLAGGGGGGSRGASSPEALAKAAISAVNDGDGDAYVQLFADPDMGDKMIDCKESEDPEERKREAEVKAEAKKNYGKQVAILKRAVALSKGPRMEFVAMEPDDPPEEVPAGKELGERCKVRVAHATQRFELAVKQGEDKREPKMSAIRIDGTWYLADLFLVKGDAITEATAEIEKDGEEEGGGGGGATAGEDEMMREFRTYVDEVCACKDMQCMSEVGDKFAAKMRGREGEYKDRKPTPEMMKLSEKMMECTRAITQAEMGKMGGPAPDGTGGP